MKPKKAQKARESSTWIPDSIRLTISFAVQLFRVSKSAKDSVLQKQIVLWSHKKPFQRKQFDSSLTVTGVHEWV